MGIKSWLGILGAVVTLGATAAPAMADECWHDEAPIVYGTYSPGYYNPAYYGPRYYGPRYYGRRWDRDDWRFRRFEHRRFEHWRGYGHRFR
jgi:hypothetical protein